MASEGRALKVFSWVLLALVLIQAACLLYGILVQVPRYGRVLNDFNTALPTATVLVLNLSRTLVLPFAVGVLVAFAVVKELLIARAAVRLLTNIVLLVVLMVFGSLLAAAVWLPLTHLVRSVQAG